MIEKGYMKDFWGTGIILSRDYTNVYMLYRDYMFSIIINKHNIYVLMLFSTC